VKNIRLNLTDISPYFTDKMFGIPGTINNNFIKSIILQTSLSSQEQKMKKGGEMRMFQLCHY